MTRLFDYIFQHAEFLKHAFHAVVWIVFLLNGAYFCQCLKHNMPLKNYLHFSPRTYVKTSGHSQALVPSDFWSMPRLCAYNFKAIARNWIAENPNAGQAWLANPCTYCRTLFIRSIFLAYLSLLWDSYGSLAVSIFQMIRIILFATCAMAIWWLSPRLVLTFW